VGRDHFADDVTKFALRARAAIRSRDWVLALSDAVIVLGSYLSVLLLRFDGHVPMGWRSQFFTFMAVAIPVHVLSNWGWGLYRQMWRHASVHEAMRVIMAGATSTVFVLSAYLVLDYPVPLSVVVLGSFVATCLTFGLRFRPRIFGNAMRIWRPEPRNGLPVVVVGAGEAGATIVREMQRGPSNALVPIAVVDDDPRKIGMVLLGVPVIGAISELVDVVRTTGSQRVILAIGGASQSLVRRVAALAEVAEVPLQVLPGFEELMRDSVSLRDVRDLQIEDLIGREEVKIDFEAIRELLSGRRVLITGGGGSIGSEIARQVARCNPAVLVLLDHDETHLHEVDASIPDSAVCALADIRDKARVQQVFDTHRPEIVFHAAAHKHVPILERQACEAVETNVLGTANLVAAAESVGAERFVFISTDKAVAPANVMGATKWMGEQIVLSQRGPTRFCAVRFGNVLGSRGSVIPTFTRQIHAGGPVTVTDERMTRFFMTIEEAVKLVLQAATFAEGGEVFLLEMGKPVNILSLAKRMIRLSGRQVGTEIKIEITGMRGGEKLTEELSGGNERSSPTSHVSIIHLDTPRLPVNVLAQRLAYFREVSAEKNDDEAADALFELAAIPLAPVAESEVDIDLVAMERSEVWSRSTT
jgi:FlaA1/EpsC-like NDP-sugar epimerase